VYVTKDPALSRADQTLVRLVILNFNRSNRETVEQFDQLIRQLAEARVRFIEPVQQHHHVVGASQPRRDLR
jgi:hypothetical protein